MYGIVAYCINQAKKNAMMVMLGCGVSSIITFGTIWSNNKVLTAVLWAVALLLEIIVNLYPLQSRLKAHKGIYLLYLFKLMNTTFVLT